MGVRGVHGDADNRLCRQEYRYQELQQPIATVEIPGFLNGYDLIRAPARFVDTHLDVTDGTLFPHR